MPVKILIVEDDPLVAKLLEDAVKKEKDFLLCAVAKSGQEALDFINGNEVDLILLDVYMPKMNGIEFLQKLRGKGFNQAVIMITAANDTETIQKAISYGITDYIIKTSFGVERLQAAFYKYREQNNLISGSKNLDQAKIDNLLKPRLKKENQDELPKGSDKITLKRIWDAVALKNKESFITEDISADLNISKITVRKYLEFMVTVNILEKDLIYAKIGRPIFRYKETPGAGKIITRFI